MASTSMSHVRNSCVMSCNVIKSTDLLVIPKWRPPLYALESCLFWKKCSIFSTTTRDETYYSSKEIDHPTLLECGTVDRAHRSSNSRIWHFYWFGKGQRSRSPILGLVNQNFDTPVVNLFFWMPKVSSVKISIYLPDLIPEILFGRPLITGGVAYNFVFSNCIMNKGVWFIKLCIMHVNQKFCAMHCC